ncbi:MAG TPA: tetratricopeptide repeat protein [Burkholderiales bacterium]|nr:tetratricopeptide repeat protein [Burkholderiales bacterium]
MTGGSSRFPILVGVGLIAGLAAALYLPFIGNPPVFDDRGFFSGWLFTYYATHPLGLELRVPPYFSLAIVQVIWGSIEAHRVFGLAFHVACALALYKLIFDLQRHAALRAGLPPATSLEAHAPAFLAAAAFAIHPVAVYGAGYLIQRMSVFATLFALVSIIFYVRGLARRSHADALSAALMYSLAVLSKETAVMLPAAAFVAGLIVAAERRFMLRHAALYLACCAPAAGLVTLLVRGKIGAAYEPDFEVVTAQIAQAGAPATAWSPWLESAVTQMGLYFRYLALWIFPDSDALSIDLRVDFAGNWPPALAFLAVGAFAGYGVLGLALMRGKGAARVAGFGLLYPWLLFLPEFATVRFQEPFVLYRSYLWGPGLMVLLASGLARLPGRAVVAAALLVLPLLIYQAHDRLATFSGSLALWEDAVAKLPRRAVPGGSRTLYNLGREYLYAERAGEAIAVAERCLAEYPATNDCHMARGSIHLHQEEYREAIPYFGRAIALRPKSGRARHHLGVALESLGCLGEAKEQYRAAARLSFRVADHRLGRLESPGSGLLAPVEPKSRTDACDELLPGLPHPDEFTRGQAPRE